MVSVERRKVSLNIHQPALNNGKDTAAGTLLVDMLWSIPGLVSMAMRNIQTKGESFTVTSFSAEASSTLTEKKNRSQRGDYITNRPDAA